MEIKAKVKNLDSSKIKEISLIFYGNGIDGKEFSLEIPYTQDGNIKEGGCEPFKKELGEYLTPQDFITMGKVYEKVQQITSNQILDLMEKSNEISKKYSKMISSLQCDNFKLEGEFNNCDEGIKQLEKNLRRLKRKDKIDEVEQKINNMLKDRDYILKQVLKNEKDIDNLYSTKVEEIENLEIIL